MPHDHNAVESSLEGRAEDVPLWVPHRSATWPTRYAELAAPVEFWHWNGKHPVDDNSTYRTVPAGTTVKIVMVSRFGDVGITEDLSAEHGYEARVGFDLLTNLRAAP